ADIIRIFKREKPLAIAFCHSPPARIDAVADRLQFLEMSRIDPDLVTGHAPQHAGDVVGMFLRPAVRAVEKEAQSLLDCLDGDEIREATKGLGITAAVNEPRNELAQLARPGLDRAGLEGAKVEFGEDILAGQAVEIGVELSLERSGERRPGQ